MIECATATTRAITTAIPTVATATGSLGRIVGWVDQAWNELQTAHDDWDWMRSSRILGAGISFATVAGDPTYPLGTGAGTVGVVETSFGKWDRDTFRCFTTTVGINDENFLANISFDAWRNGYMFGAQQTVQTRPFVIAVGPDQSLNLGPPPNALYTITGDYFVAPSTMTADTDVPTGLPVRFHMLIVYYAMQKYAAYESAPEVEARAVKASNRMYAELQRARAPKIGWAGALA